MNIKYLYFLFIIISLFISCSNSQTIKLSYSESETVKDYIKNREKDVTWTKEVEGTLLTENISSFERIENSELVRTDVFNILPEYQIPVYPAIQNFGSLDTSCMPEKLKTTVNEFCKAISENIYFGADKYFNKKFLFNYIFFRNEIIENWSLFFDEEFPVKAEAFEELKKEDVKNEENKKIMPPAIFSKWYLGEPFISEELIEIPVRFFSKKGNIDVTIFMDTNNENSIYQIVINRWDVINVR